MDSAASLSAPVAMSAETRIAEMAAWTADSGPDAFALDAAFAVHAAVVADWRHRLTRYLPAF